ncbi:hypothetical protein [Clostridium aminobutyricum]|uniref:Uncharacterized protein n=1 Tax=Clostridium aminobutyricum TaxID=33953 RepID=A0A939D8E5_CLOAM|nr:hypothetical protein [Clostridium aminobutyricum]MBN7773010.1 hypothetical protein [Clostridium aminobutyricum]
MEISKRDHLVFIVCIAAIAAAALAAIGYIQWSKLDEPVFTESFLEIGLPEVKMYDSETDAEVELKQDGLYYPLETGGEERPEIGIQPGSDRLMERFREDCEFQLKCITNIDDPIEIVGIAFDEAPELAARISGEPNVGSAGVWVYSGGNQSKSGVPYGRFTIKTMYITLGDENKEVFMDLIKNNKTLELNHATIYAYANNNNLTFKHVNIGRILLTPIKKEEAVLDRIAGTGIGDNEGIENTDTYIAKKDVHLVSVQSPLMEELQNSIQIEIGKTSYKDAAGLQWNKGDKISIKSRAKPPGAKAPGYFGYQLLPVVTLEDEDGNQYQMQISPMSYSNGDFGYTTAELRQYLRERGVI